MQEPAAQRGHYRNGPKYVAYGTIEDRLLITAGSGHHRSLTTENEYKSAFVSTWKEEQNAHSSSSSYSLWLSLPSQLSSLLFPWLLLRQLTLWASLNVRLAPRPMATAPAFLPHPAPQADSMLPTTAPGRRISSAVSRRLVPRLRGVACA